LSKTSGFSFYVLHNLQDLDLKPQAAGFDAVISVTLTRPSNATIREFLLNPGARGHADFSFPVTLALLEIAKKP